MKHYPNSVLFEPPDTGLNGVPIAAGGDADGSILAIAASGPIRGLGGVVEYTSAAGATSIDVHVRAMQPDGQTPFPSAIFDSLFATPPPARNRSVPFMFTLDAMLGRSSAGVPQSNNCAYMVMPYIAWRLHNADAVNAIDAAFLWVILLFEARS